MITPPRARLLSTQATLPNNTLIDALIALPNPYLFESAQLVSLVHINIATDDTKSITYVNTGKSPPLTKPPPPTPPSLQDPIRGVTSFLSATPILKTEETPHNVDNEEHNGECKIRNSENVKES